MGYIRTRARDCAPDPKELMRIHAAMRARSKADAGQNELAGDLPDIKWTIERLNGILSVGVFEDWQKAISDAVALLEHAVVIGRDAEGVRGKRASLIGEPCSQGIIWMDTSTGEEMLERYED